MRVISMVPSWTELLIECDVDVVGRTRFCIHPKNKIQSIPVMGGTKDFDSEKIKSLQPDFILMDKEENPREMSELGIAKNIITHITKIEDVGTEIEKISLALENEKLQSIARRWKTIAAKENLKWNWRQIPGAIQSLKQTEVEYANLIYIIWKNPWMSVSKDTFIGSVLQKLGATDYLLPFDKKYPEINLEKLRQEKIFFLFSSEPFPFQKKHKELLDLKIDGAIVDGELYSWFGLRSLEFLENCYLIKS